MDFMKAVLTKYFIFKIVIYASNSFYREKTCYYWKVFREFICK